MLDLQARVGFYEGIALAGTVDDELDGTETPVACRLSDVHRGAEKRLAQLRSDARAGRNLDDLLMAALDAAFALPDVAHRAAAVAQHLHLQVAGLRQEFLDVDPIVTKGESGFGAAARESLFQIGSAADHPHAPTAAAGDGLDHHVDAVGKTGEKRPRLLERHRRFAACQQRHAAGRGKPARAHLVAQQREGFRSRADESEPSRLHRRRKLGVLAQKAVARMHGVATGPAGHIDHLRNIQIGSRPAARERFGFVRP